MRGTRLPKDFCWYDDFREYLHPHAYTEGSTTESYPDEQNACDIPSVSSSYPKSWDDDGFSLLAPPLSDMDDDDDT